jgi:hypothetical protein
MAAYSIFSEMATLSSFIGAIAAFLEALTLSKPIARSDGSSG